MVQIIIFKVTSLFQIIKLIFHSKQTKKLTQDLQDDNQIILTTKNNIQLYGKIIKQFKGCTNDNILIQIQNQKYLLRKQNSKQIPFRNDEIPILLLLQQNNIQYTNKNDIILLQNEVLIKFIDGNILISDFQLSEPKIYKQVITQLHNLHKLNSTYQDCFNEEKNIFQKIEAKKLLRSEKLNFLKEKSIKIHSLIESQNSQFSGYQVFKPTICHCDLHSGNIIFNEENCKFIDFEYARPALSIFDLTCFFAEFCGIEVDLNLYPDLQTKKQIFASYQNGIQWNSNFIEILTYYEILTNLMWSVWGYALNIHPYAEKRFQLAETLFMSF